MIQPLLVSGLPRSLERDGWWLDAPVAGPPDVPQGEAQTTRGPHWAGLVGLVALADLLFWHYAPGLSLALFALAILGVAAARSGRLSARPVVLLVLAAAPVVEHLQALSLTFLGLGLASTLVWQRRPEAGMAEMLALTAAWLRRLPGQWLVPRSGVLRHITCPSRASESARKALRDWAFPLAGSLVFLGLLMQANPVLAQVLSLDLDLWSALSRAAFWGAAALFIAPLLSPDLPAPVPLSSMALPRAGRLGLNPRSVLRALVLFNALIALQSLTDLSILVFGATLPGGMSLAEYAHRGAYPLLATALLAGAFALAARPFLHEHRAIRPLLLVWLAQNMVLCGAAMMRLEHYIDTFGLTYLRLYALIWMGLVAIGLGLVAVQLLRGRSAAWLLTRCAALGLGTLYLCAFVNFAQIIASQNLARANPDTDYICSLGPMAHGALLDATRANPGLQIEPRPCAIWFPPQTVGWREWGFRSWRVARYSASMNTPGQMR